MLKWLFGKRTATQAPAEPAPTSSEAQASANDAAVAAVPPNLEVPAPPPSSPPVAEPVSLTVGQGEPALFAKISAFMTKAEDEVPRVGADAIIVTPTNLRKATVVRVQAGGRRIVAKLGDAQSARAYLLRADGTYRPEGAPSQIASRLVISSTA